ncbi:GntR family transcriptional regulator (plasmid) [Paraburkholderia terrae]|uniref:GntR family transcriptional regulator n=1 Tax=Paraburkholderia terrae TaxID=311230 RepID=A0ABM7U2Q5_9BURK|nr:GntR family transcriptional regulator [Paraburkholderia terrae]BCZ85616.1 GntR family transcriptional regulator [Paraburkholderia terrae]
MKTPLPLEKSNLSSRTYEQIRNALMNGEYSPGDRIRIANMAESLGISITPVREAIFRLVSEQALEMTAATSIKVPELDSATVAEIQLMRRLLEGAAGERAALVVTKPQIEALSATHDSFIAAVSVSPADAARINRDFHFQLLSIAGMPSLFDVVAGLWVRMGPLLHVFHSHVPARAISNRHHPHYRVLSGLKKKDSAAVSTAIQEDIAWGERVLLEWMSQNNLRSA